MIVDNHYELMDNTVLVALVCHLTINSGGLGQTRKGAAAAVILCVRNGWRESHLP